ncbi:organic cation/carnitine transporter 2-like [Syngnathoides biaculeatus]|uniref:organic cation/carnitine transporter 2-like n=1 Tax=Syngnathoides biaculeatus TaxID=300417 RepID=UPI002ADE214D|nr:organic cation/carnitine transporter 2-like [Syngnathoides biaculeatus]
MQDYEDSVSFLGSWGPFQRRVVFQLCLAAIPSGYNMLSSLYLLAVPPHTCQIPTANLSQEWMEAAIPLQLVSGHMEKSSCSRFQLSLIQNLSILNQNVSTLGTTWDQNLRSLGSGSGPQLSSLKQEDCKDGWTFSKEHYQSTVVTEFNLVCEDQWKPPLSTLAYFLGGVCGCVISGQISDRFGRKPVLLGSIAFLSISCSVLALAPSWELFSVIFFLVGFGQISCFVVVFVLGTEILTGPIRVLFGNLCMPFAFAFGMLLLPGTAYLVRTWRRLALILALPGLSCVPLWWLLPESPRWLVSRGHLRRAEVLLSSAAVENRVRAPEVIFKTTKVENLSLNRSESLNFMDLVQTKNIRHISLILWIVWFSANLSYFGISFNMSSLSGNPFVNYFLVVAIELPAYTASWLASRRLPRRLSFIAFSLLGALALLLVQITVKAHPVLTLFLVLLGKFGILAGVSILYTYSGELYPTVIRNTALSFCATFSRLGSAVSPYILELGVWYELLPWILVGSLSVFGVALSIFLPETFTHPLPDTIQQMATMQKWPCSSPAAKHDGKPSEDQTTGPQIICTTHF